MEYEPQIAEIGEPNNLAAPHIINVEWRFRLQFFNVLILTRANYAMRKLRLRFGLRTLLILVTLCAIAVIFVGNRMYRDFLQAEAIEAIKEASGQMVQNEAKDVTRVLFRGAAFGDEQLKSLAQHLGNLPKLEELDFVRAGITDEGVQALVRLSHLKELYLFETKVTDQGMAELGQRFPNVTVKTEQPEPISSGMAMMPVYTHAMIALNWTPDGSFLATGSGDGEIRLWDFQSREPAYRWKAHEDWAFAVAFSPDGQWIATGGGDNAVRIWDATTHDLMFELVGHTDDVHSVEFTPDGSTLVSAGDDCVIRVWDLASQESVRVMEGHRAQIPAIAIGPHGKLLASASRDDTVRLWDLETGETLAVLPTDQFDVNAVAFDSGEKSLASGDQGGNIQIWDLKTQTLTKTLTGHNGKVYKIAFDGSDQTLASCGDDGIRMWRLDSGESRAIGKKQEYVSTVAFHPSRDLLASASAAGELHLMDALTGETLDVLCARHGERGFALPVE